MARARSLTNLIADVRQRTNMENSEFVTDPELTEYLNQELAELHGKLTLGEGHPHFRSQNTISVTSGTALYALPADFWRVQRVTVTWDNLTRDIEPFMEGERAGLMNNQMLVYSSHLPRYRIQADNIEFRPATRAFTADLFYVRASPRLSAGGDTVDGFNGYEVAALYGVCATVLQKEESDPSFYMSQKAAVYRLIDAQAAHRDGSHPERVTDVLGEMDLFPVRLGWG